MSCIVLCVFHKGRLYGQPVEAVADGRERGVFWVYLSLVERKPRNGENQTMRQAPTVNHQCRKLRRITSDAHEYRPPLYVCIWNFDSHPASYIVIFEIVSRRIKHKHGTCIPLFVGFFDCTIKSRVKWGKGGQQWLPGPPTSGALYTQLGRSRRPGASQCIFCYTRLFNCSHKSKIIHTNHKRK